jgi:hypothetical protein
VSIKETIDRRPLAARTIPQLAQVVDAFADIHADLPDAIERQIFDES